MPVNQKRYTLSGIIIDAAGLVGGPTIIGGIGSLSMNQNNEIDQEASSGDVFLTSQPILAQKPEADFTTPDISNALDEFGYQFASIATLGDITLLAKKMATFGTRSGAGTDYSMFSEMALLSRRRSQSTRKETSNSTTR